MTEPDTTALRALADAHPSAWVWSHTLRALCDGYDEAARLRGRRVEISRHPDMPAECRVWRNDVLVFDGVDRSALLSRPAADASRDAARQALATMSEAARIDTAAKVALVADLTAARQALADLAADLLEQVTESGSLNREEVERLISRHTPEEPR